MFKDYGWAAFLASVSVLMAFSVAPAAAGGRPVYACFSAQNALAMARLGPNDPSVRHGFETGECLALPPTTALNDVERGGAVWRFRVFGGAPYLYGPDWASAPPGFERYLPVTAQLIAQGRTFVKCYDDSVELSRRFDDLERRWREYMARNGEKIPQPGMKVIVFVGDLGPQLMAESESLRREGARLNRRCGSVAAMEADEDFLALMRSARHA